MNKKEDLADVYVNEYLKNQQQHNALELFMTILTHKSIDQRYIQKEVNDNIYYQRFFFFKDNSFIVINTESVKLYTFKRSVLEIKQLKNYIDAIKALYEHNTKNRMLRH